MDKQHSDLSTPDSMTAVAEEIWDPLILKEKGWRQTTPTYCTGTFEVESIPPGTRKLDMFVMDSNGTVIGSNMEYERRGFSIGALVEFNFECGDCSNVSKWRVQGSAL